MPSADDRSSADVLKAAQSGDMTACDQLLREHQPMIWAICRRILGDDHSAADASQEAMISIVRTVRRFDGRSSLRTWIYRIATNAALDEIRRRGRRPHLMDDASIRITEPTVGDGAAAIDDRLLIDHALATLTPEFRAAIVLRDLADLEYADIGDVLGIPPGTVRSRIARGRRALADVFQATEGNHGGESDRPKDGSLQEPPLI